MSAKMRSDSHKKDRPNLTNRNDFLMDWEAFVAEQGQYMFPSFESRRETAREQSPDLSTYPPIIPPSSQPPLDPSSFRFGAPISPPLPATSLSTNTASCSDVSVIKTAYAFADPPRVINHVSTEIIRPGIVRILDSTSSADAPLQTTLSLNIGSDTFSPVVPPPSIPPASSPTTMDYETTSHICSSPVSLPDWMEQDSSASSCIAPAMTPDSTDEDALPDIVARIRKRPIKGASNRQGRPHQSQKRPALNGLLAGAPPIPGVQPASPSPPAPGESYVPCQPQGASCPPPPLLLNHAGRKRWLKQNSDAHQLPHAESDTRSLHLDDRMLVGHCKDPLGLARIERNDGFWEGPNNCIFLSIRDFLKVTPKKLRSLLTSFFLEASTPDQEAFSRTILDAMPEKHFLELSLADKIRACDSSLSSDGHIPADLFISFLNSKAKSGSIGELLKDPCDMAFMAEDWEGSKAELCASFEYPSVGPRGLAVVMCNKHNNHFVRLLPRVSARSRLIAALRSMGLKGEARPDPATTQAEPLAPRTTQHPLLTESSGANLCSPPRDEACVQEQNSPVASLDEHSNADTGATSGSSDGVALPLPPRATSPPSSDSVFLPLSPRATSPPAAPPNEESYEDGVTFLARKLGDLSISCPFASPQSCDNFASSASFPPGGLAPQDSHSMTESTDTLSSGVEDLLVSRLSRQCFDRRDAPPTGERFVPVPSDLVAENRAGPLCLGGAVATYSYSTVHAAQSSDPGSISPQVSHQRPELLATPSVAVPSERSFHQNEAFRALDACAHSAARVNPAGEQSVQGLAAVVQDVHSKLSCLVLEAFARTMQEIALVRQEVMSRVTRPEASFDSVSGFSECPPVEPVTTARSLVERSVSPQPSRCHTSSTFTPVPGVIPALAKNAKTSTPHSLRMNAGESAARLCDHHPDDPPQSVGHPDVKDHPRRHDEQWHFVCRSTSDPGRIRHLRLPPAQSLSIRNSFEALARDLPEADDEIERPVPSTPLDSPVKPGVAVPSPRASGRPPRPRTLRDFIPCPLLSSNNPKLFSTRERSGRAVQRSLSPLSENDIWPSVGESAASITDCTALRPPVDRPCFDGKWPLRHEQLLDEAASSQESQPDGPPFSRRRHSSRRKLSRCVPGLFGCY